jgi:hypothetical protein
MNGPIMKTNSELTSVDRMDHVLARVGYHRMDHKVEPGLYSLGGPLGTSPVFVTANYTLSFDALRTALKGTDGYILVLDTKGINVWCAAGKGSFGTEELVQRIEATDLKNVVSHRKLILPQLGAPGVAAHEVKKRTGFTVEYGPVRAEDVPEYIKGQGATGEMRRVRFNVKDRALLIPVEVRNNLFWAIPVPLLLLVLGQLWTAALSLTLLLSGAVLFPLLLPFLPTRAFSSKGMLLGAFVGVVFWAIRYLSAGSSIDMIGTAELVAYVLLLSGATGYLGLNWTGCSTYTSRTGVKKEIFRFIPAMVASFAVGVGMMALIGAVGLLGW